MQHVLLVFITFSIFAQKGILAGKVIDEKTAETLIGTTVVVTGTTIGAITDFDGNFNLELDPGTYSVTCSYVSYQSKVFEDILIIAGEVTQLDVQLGEAVTALDEVIISAKARQRSEAAIQALQRKSAIVLDGISANQITKMGDSDAAGCPETGYRCFCGRWEICLCKRIK